MIAELPAAAFGRDAPLSPDAGDEKAFGFWIYLMTDAIIFALLFATYVVLAGNTAKPWPGFHWPSVQRICV